MYSEIELLGLDAKYFPNVIGEKEVLEIFYSCNAVFLHNGNLNMPHVELSSGLCSNGCFNCRKVLQYPSISEVFARELYRLVISEIPQEQKIDWVIGSPYSSTVLSYEMAVLCKAKHGCFLEKDTLSPKKMIWRGDPIKEGKVVLQVEDLITTGNTFSKVYKSVQEASDEVANFLPVVACIVHRPPKLPVEYEGVKIISLVEKEVWAISQQECPLCKAGSKRLKPKEHWSELTGKK